MADWAGQIILGLIMTIDTSLVLAQIERRNEIENRIEMHKLSDLDPQYSLESIVELLDRYSDFFW